MSETLSLGAAERIAIFGDDPTDTAQIAYDLPLDVRHNARRTVRLHELVPNGGWSEEARQRGRDIRNDLELVGPGEAK